MDIQETQYGNEWDASTGWWVEKPAPNKGALKLRSRHLVAERGAPVGRNAALVVGLIFTVLALISLALR